MKIINIINFLFDIPYIPKKITEENNSRVIRIIGVILFFPLLIIVVFLVAILIIPGLIKNVRKGKNMESFNKIASDDAKRKLIKKNEEIEFVKKEEKIWNDCIHHNICPKCGNDLNVGRGVQILGPFLDVQLTCKNKNCDFKHLRLVDIIIEDLI